MLDRYLSRPIYLQEEEGGASWKIDGITLYNYSLRFIYLPEEEKGVECEFILSIQLAIIVIKNCKIAYDLTIVICTRSDARQYTNEIMGGSVHRVTLAYSLVLTRCPC